MRLAADAPVRRRVPTPTGGGRAGAGGACAVRAVAGVRRVVANRASRAGDGRFVADLPAATRPVAVQPPEPVKPAPPPNRNPAPAPKPVADEPPPPKAPDIALEKKQAETARLKKLKAIQEAEDKAREDAARAEADALKKTRDKQAAEQKKAEPAAPDGSRRIDAKHGRARPPRMPPGRPDRLKRRLRRAPGCAVTDRRTISRSDQRHGARQHPPARQPERQPASALSGEIAAHRRSGERAGDAVERQCRRMTMRWCAPSRNPRRCRCPPSATPALPLFRNFPLPIAPKSESAEVRQPPAQSAILARHSTFLIEIPAPCCVLFSCSPCCVWRC